jgi:hypothetical protein
MSSLSRAAVGRTAAALLAASFVGPAVPEAAAARSTVLTAVVAADGTLVRGAGAVSASLLAPGSYELRFDRPVTGCEVNAGPGATGAGNPYEDVPGATLRVRFQRDPSALRIQTAAAFPGGGPIDAPVNVQVACDATGAWAVVDASGAVARAGSGVVGATHLAVGSYAVSFTAQAVTCAVLVTIGSSDTTSSGAGQAYVVNGADRRSVDVAIVQANRKTGGVSPADLPFHVRRVCGASDLWALVAPDGTLIAGTATGASLNPPRLGTPYEVDFAPDVSGCADVATPRQSNPPFAGTGPVTTALDPAASDAVLVAPHDAGGLFSEGEFGLVVSC